MRAVRLAAVALACLLGWPAAPAMANAGGHANAGEHGVDSGASNDETRSAPAHRTRRRTDCKWTPVEPEVASELRQGGGFAEADGIWADPDWIAPDTPGTWYWIDCAWGERTMTFVPERTPINPARLAHQAQRRLELEAPTVSLRPGVSARHLVNSATWLRVDDWQPLQSTVSVPGVTVTVNAVPERVVWTIEDGTFDSSGEPHTVPITCEGPGYPASDEASSKAAATSCEFVWPRSSATSPDGKLGLTAAVVYRVTWSVVGAPGGGDLGLIESVPASLRVVVVEQQTSYRVHESGGTR